MLPAIRRLLFEFRRLTAYANYGGGARRYILRGLGLGRGQRPWIFNVAVAIGALALTIATAGSALGIMASAEAPNEARATAGVTSFRLAGPASLRTPRPPASSLPVVIERTYPFVWPAWGPITSYMEPSHPTGIDIGLDNDIDVEVRASAGGIVTFAGGSEYESYGYHVIIDHGNDVSTLYAHLETPLVSAGEPVAQGQAIGIGGSTGKSDGKHLHFEVRIGKTWIDPFEVLPENNVDSEQSSLDCMTSGFVLDAGSSVQIDFASTLLATASITDVRLSPASPEGTTPNVTTRATTRAAVQLDSAVDLIGPDRDEHFNLAVAFEQDGRSNTIECELTLRTSGLVPAYHVTQAAPAPQPQAAPYVAPVPPTPVVVEIPTVEIRPLPSPTLAIPTNVPLLGGGLPTPPATPVTAPASPTQEQAQAAPTETPQDGRLPSVAPTIGNPNGDDD